MSKNFPSRPSGKLTTAILVTLGLFCGCDRERRSEVAHLAGDRESGADGTGGDIITSRHWRIENKDKACISCHEEKQVAPRTIQEWIDSKHAANGVGCSDCHGPSHEEFSNSRGHVSAEVCARCHEKQFDRFTHGRHAKSMDTITEHAQLKTESPSIGEKSCKTCHGVGRLTRGPSGKVIPGKCSSCHRGHGFRLSEARQPQTCAECHSGEATPQYDLFAVSVHGTLNATKNGGATCVDCHDPHADSEGITFGTVGNGAVAVSSDIKVVARRISDRLQHAHRSLMLDRCLKCHASSLVTESLQHADAIKNEADETLEEMYEMVRELEREGLLARAQSENQQQTGHPVLLGGQQIIKGTSRIERLYFDAFKVWHPLMWKAAYHNAPTKVVEARRKLDMIFAAMNDEAARLRNRQ